MNGWAGKILRVDLTKGKAVAQPLARGLAIDYLGSRGVNARILWDELPPNADPLAPTNILIFGAGPLNATFAPCSGRLTVSSKSPATNLYTKSSVGGHLAAEMKLAGYDIIVFYGCSKSPIYLWIDGEEVEFRDASYLWGKNVRETAIELREEIGDRNIQIAAIGQAGENLVKFASIMTSIYRAAGRTGIGAVMGSKRLKAIAVRGTGCVTVADPDRFEQVALKARQDLRNDKNSWPVLYTHGTQGIVGPGPESSGVYSAKNFRTEILPAEHLKNLSGKNITQRYLTRREGCSSCVYSCGRFTEVKNGEYAGTYCGGPEMETWAAYGGRCFASSPELIIKANELTNLYGLDSISTGSTIAFAMECYENGLISKEDADDVALHWGSPDAILGLIRKIALREGIGDTLAEGTKRAAERIGRDAYKYAVQAKGLENGSGDGRRFKAHSGLAFAVNPRGPDHLHTEVLAELPISADAAKLLDTLGVPHDPQSLEGKPELVKWHEEMYCAADCLGLCVFTNTFSYLWINFDNLAEMFQAATGIPMNAGGLQLTCERILNLEKAINVREGASRKDDSLPWRILNEPTYEGFRITEEDLNKMLDRYYELHGWDKETSWPTDEKLLELGMASVAKELKKMRKLPS